MPSLTPTQLERRVLLLPPTKRDGEVTCALLESSGAYCDQCSDITDLIREISRGAAALLFTDDVLKLPEAIALSNLLDQQPPWSDLPIVMLAQGGSQSPQMIQVLGSLRNVTLLERPTSTRSVVSAVQAAIRGRKRQYQNRQQIEAIRLADARAREFEGQLEIAIEASQLGTFHCEFPLGTIIWNNRCKEHFWLPPDTEIDFDLFYSILHPDDREHTRQAVTACVNEGSVYDVEYRTVSPTGAQRCIRATGRTFYDKVGRPICFDGTTQDITEQRRRAEQRQQLLEAEQAARVEAERVGRMKDEFLTTLSHELRTPLNAIFGWTQLIKMDGADPQVLTEGIEVIDRNVRVQTQLIDDLLDMSRIISGKVRLDLQTVNVLEIVKAAISSAQPTADAKGVRLENVADQHSIAISGDPGRLQQVLWNLLTNAIKFTPRGGKVCVLLESLQSQLQVSVIDTGQGIDAEFLPYIFERFSQADGSTTRKHGGLGLGLSIVKTLVEMHGGSIQAHSAGADQGASFVISLPVRVAVEGEPIQFQQHRAETTFSKALQLPRLSGIRVLVVDDEQDARELVGRFLQQSEACPALAASAAQALEMLDEFQPDVILSDIGMPEQDGYELIRTVRDRGIKTPAIALSAFVRGEDRIRSIQAGYQTHLPKPVEPAELLAVVASLAGRYTKSVP